MVQSKRLNPTFSGMWSATGKKVVIVADRNVLILLFLECGLRLNRKDSTILQLKSLNPTFSGMWSATNNSQAKSSGLCCLNPTFSGMWSATIKQQVTTFLKKVS